MKTPTLVMSGLAIAAAFSHQVAAAVVPLTDTMVTVVCTGPATVPGQTIGPLPVGLSLPCDRSEAFSPTVRGDPVEYALFGAVDTGLGAGSNGSQHTVGTVKAEAELSTSGVRNVTASLGGVVWFYYAIDQIQIPATVPAKVPLFFHAQGEGHSTVNGSASASFGASVQGVGEGFPFALFQLGGSGTASDSFNQRVTLLVAPGVYGGTITAGCAVGGEGYINAEGYAVTGSATCNVAIDPTLGFDQTAFDLAMGANTFPLGEYYRISLSPNLPVPEPRIAMLLLAGLAVVGPVARRRRRAGHAFLHTAIDTLDTDKVRTRDPGGTAGTARFIRAMVKRIGVA